MASASWSIFGLVVSRCRYFASMIILACFGFVWCASMSGFGVFPVSGAMSLESFGG